MDEVSSISIVLTPVQLAAIVKGESISSEAPSRTDCGEGSHQPVALQK